jgi:hypothetical protein
MDTPWLRVLGRREWEPVLGSGALLVAGDWVRGVPGPGRGELGRAEVGVAVRGDDEDVGGPFDHADFVESDGGCFEPEAVEDLLILGGPMSWPTGLTSRGTYENDLIFSSRAVGRKYDLPAGEQWSQSGVACKKTDRGCPARVSKDKD